MGSLRELESMLGPMGNAMRDNGLMDSSMDQECGGGLKVIRIQVSGEMEKLMDMEFMCGQMVTNIKVNSKSL